MIRVNAQYDVEYRPAMTVQDVLDALKFSFRMIVVKVDGKVVLRTTSRPPKCLTVRRCRRST